MNKKYLLLSVLGAAGGVALALLLSPERQRSAESDKFPPEKLAGYHPGARLLMVEPGKSGGPVIAWAVVPYGIKQEQIAPTGHWALKNVRFKSPGADRIAVYIAEDSAMAAASNFVGLAELRGDAVVLSGGLPTQAQLDSLANLGQPLRRPTPEDLKVAALVFDSTAELKKTRRELSRSLLGASGRIDKARFANLDLSTPVLHAIGKSKGRSGKEVQATVVGVTRYYWLRAGDPL